jgi:chloramphenicol-sensitive protein RarD
VSRSLSGVLAVIGACLVWGLSGIYFKALAMVPPLELVSHRVIWTVVFFAVVLAAQGRFREAPAALARPRTLAALACTATLILANWLGFVLAIQTGRALEASLGYYVFPLVAVALGYFVLGERFSRLQAVAVGLAALAVMILTVGLGAPPWIALMLASTFGGYGLIKNRLGLPPAVSVFVETLLIAPFALTWLFGLHAGLWTDPSGRPGAWFGRDAWVTFLLVLSGPLMTGGPLMLFTYAARNIRLATLGLVQYLNPTLQFVVAVGLFGEVFTRWHAVAFPMIWAALALYTAEAWRRSRAIPVAEAEPLGAPD